MFNIRDVYVKNKGVYIAKIIKNLMLIDFEKEKMLINDESRYIDANLLIIIIRGYFCWE